MFSVFCQVSICLKVAFWGLTIALSLQLNQLNLESCRISFFMMNLITLFEMYMKSFKRFFGRSRPQCKYVHSPLGGRKSHGKSPLLLLHIFYILSKSSYFCDYFQMKKAHGRETIWDESGLCYCCLMSLEKEGLYSTTSLHRQTNPNDKNNKRRHIEFIHADFLIYNSLTPLNQTLIIKLLLSFPFIYIVCFWIGHREEAIYKSNGNIENNKHQ